MGRYEIRKESVAPSQNALVIKWFRAKRLLCPFIVRFIVAENLSVAVVRSNAKVCRLGAVPLILDRFDEENEIAKPTLDRAFVSFMAGIALDADFIHPTVRLNLTR